MKILFFVLLFVVKFIYCNAEFKHEGDEGCPSGANRFDDRCFRLSYLEATFDGAEKYCNSTGGTMIKWKDEKTDYIVQKLKLRQYLNRFWIDAKDDRVKEETNENSVSRIRRDLADSSTCSNLKVELDYQLQEILCRLKRFYICQYNGSNCKNGSDRSVYGSQCFELNYKFAKYKEAINSCESKGGHLAKVKTKEDFEFIKNFISTDKSWKSIPESDISQDPFKYLVRPTWIGIRFLNKKWIYSDGTDATNYTNWNQIKEPLDNYDCARVEYQKWSFIKCHNVQGFVCQYQFNSSSISSVSVTQEVPMATSSWSNAQIIGFLFGAFFLGIAASVLVWVIVRTFSRSKKSYKIEQS